MKKDRIQISKDEGFEIVIKALYDEGKQKLLILWMILWTLAGLGIISQLFMPQSNNEGFTTYIIVLLAFWAYFEYKVIYAYRWRRYGQERLWISDEKLCIAKEIAGRSIPQKYEADWIKNLRMREVKESNVVYALSKAYWNPGDEQVVFNFKGKEVFFGMELEKVDSKRIIQTLNKKLNAMRS